MNVNESQILTYEEECKSVRDYLFEENIYFDINKYNKYCKEFYIHKYKTTNYIKKTKEIVWNELCEDFKSYYITNNYSITFDQYKSICQNIWEVNLNPKNNVELFEREQKLILDTFEKWLNRWLKNPLVKEEMFNKIHKFNVFSTLKSNLNPKTKDFVYVNMNGIWGLKDLVAKIYEFPDLEFWVEYVRQNNSINEYLSTLGRFFKHGKLMCDGLNNTVTKNNARPSRNFAGKNKYLHCILLQILIPGIKLEMINHIDGNKYNSILINLEPSNGSHNIIHALYELGIGSSVAVKKINIENPLSVTIFANIKEASVDAKIEYGLFRTHLSQNRFFETEDQKYVYIYKDENYTHAKRVILDTIDIYEFARIEILKSIYYNPRYFNNNIYFISKYTGRVVKFVNGKFHLLTNSLGEGYFYIKLIDDTGYYGRYLISRLLLIAHLKGTTGRTDQYQDYTELVVDHINRITSDNRFDNLRFLTYQENAELGRGLKAIGLVSINRYSHSDLYKLDKLRGVEIVYDNVFADCRVAADIFNSHYVTIQQACYHKFCKSNYIFDYIDDATYEKFKYKQNAIFFTKNATQGIKVIAKYLGNTYIFDSITNADKELGLKQYQIKDFMKYNTDCITTTISSNFVVTQEFKCEKIIKNKEYVLQKYVIRKKIQVVYQKYVSNGRKCWIDNQEFVSVKDASKSTGLAISAFDTFIANYQNDSKIIKPLLIQGREHMLFDCSICPGNGRRSIRPFIEDTSTIDFTIIDDSNIACGPDHVVIKNSLFELSKPHKFLNDSIASTSSNSTSSNSTSSNSTSSNSTSSNSTDMSIIDSDQNDFNEVNELDLEFEFEEE